MEQHNARRQAGVCAAITLKTTKPDTDMYQALYSERESNPHSVYGNRILSPACLPVPPSEQVYNLLKIKPFFLMEGLRAKDEIRTRDPDLGKVVLYQLSYFRIGILPALSKLCAYLVCGSANIDRIGCSARKFFTFLKIVYKWLTFKTSATRSASNPRPMAYCCSL